MLIWILSFHSMCVQSIKFILKWSNETGHHVKSVDYLDGVNDHIIAYLEDLDAVHDRAAVVREEWANRLAEQINKRMDVYVLMSD